MIDASTDLMTSAARLYYLDGLGQHEVAAILGVSRSTVSRLIAAARERGIVRISIDPYEPRARDLERRLRERHDLHHAVVIKTVAPGIESVRRAVGFYAAPALVAMIAPETTIGVTGGRTLGEAIRFMTPVDPVPGVGVVQLMGHVDPTARRMDAPELGRQLSQRFGGSFSTLTAPAFVPDRPTRDVFLAHEQIRTLWRRFETLEVAFVGIGTLEESMFAERGVLDRADRARLRAAGAVGEICGRFFDRDGQECATDYRERVISIGLDQLRRREVVAVTNGVARRDAILAALRGGLIGSLVIDHLGAEALLRPDLVLQDQDEERADQLRVRVSAVGRERRCQ